MKVKCVWYQFCGNEFESEKEIALCDFHKTPEGKREIEGIRRKRAMFSKSGNQSYGSIPWARK